MIELGNKGKDGKITTEDMAGGTFTISNGGVFGSLMGTPILNPPQSAILGMHAVINRPVVRGENIVARPLMYERGNLFFINILQVHGSDI